MWFYIFYQDLRRAKIAWDKNCVACVFNSINQNMQRKPIMVSVAQIWAKNEIYTRQTCYNDLKYCSHFISCFVWALTFEDVLYRCCKIGYTLKEIIL